MRRQTGRGDHGGKGRECGGKNYSRGVTPLFKKIDNKRVCPRTGACFQCRVAGRGRPVEGTSRRKKRSVWKGVSFRSLKE